MADLRTLRTQKMIIRAFTDLLHHEPFSKITVNELAVAALINRSTFYKHFVDKFALLDYIFEKVLLDEQIDTKNIYHQPFRMLAQIKSSNLKPLIQAQTHDEQFVKAFSDFFFTKTISQHQEISTLNQSFFIGRVTAITRWIQVTHQQYNIFTDYEELDHIFNEG
ncbi:TetR/AcrR family transcriptional regulator [Pediococcus argentinicus]|nr:TetR/AcrR family transcriptional regulator [Pediococcus argentinicus]NKZ22612.1 TetR family transcriptional regulator [Pediococcus argentinicus]GEP20363.1 TetR family transcriptional regulator [Pediococcus argentinicus]